MVIVHIKTYGCTANSADSVLMEHELVLAGAKLTDSEAEADVVVVNSCSVKTPTENKVKRYVRNLAKKKKVVLMGCLVDNLDVKKNLPNVVASFGANQPEKIIPTLKKLGFKLESKTTEKPRYGRITPININYGCTGACTFCQTKIARGDVRSFSIQRIKAVAEKAVGQGCKEIRITSQDTGAYGTDRGTNLPELLNELVKIEEDFKIRVGMMNPDHLKKFLPELIEVYKNPKILKFLHLPAQSGSDRILRRMLRVYTVEDFKNLVKEFRAKIPEVTISTDIIVGFPGETDEDFQKTVDLLEWLQPEVLNLSKFWVRPGTRAAKMEQVSGEEIKRRSKLITEKFNRCKIN